MITPIMYCFSFAMILLEEIDDKVARYFMIMPPGKSGYLLSRVGLPAVISLLFTPLLLLFFHISSMNTSALLSVSLLGATMAFIVALIIVSLSTNKLEGMAATKMVDVYITYLRKKVDENQPIKLIHTIRGIGYCMKVKE